MDIAEEAFIAKRLGDEEKAFVLFRRALEYEEKAASLLSIAQKNEPTRSILFRSAAALAKNAQEFEVAERLIANGLAGFPPSEIKEELKNLYEDLNFERHLSLKGLCLGKEHWLMTIHGKATSYGRAAADQLMTRVDRLSVLFYRTVERLVKLPYRTNGGVSKEIKDSFGLFINSFPARSFGVSFQIGRPSPQLYLQADMVKNRAVEPSHIINEIFTCFELFESEKNEALKERISDETYYENFVGLAKQMGPDGDEISLVGFNALLGGKERPVQLRKTRRKSTSKKENQEISEKRKDEVTLVGSLRQANSPLKGRFGFVKLVAVEDQKVHTVAVPISLMKDVVQPFYEENVVIHARKEGSKLILEEIAPNKE